MVKFGVPKDDFWKKQVDGVFTVVLGCKDDASGWHVSERKAGKLVAQYDEPTKWSAKRTLKNMYWTEKSHGMIVSFDPGAKKAFGGPPDFRDVEVDVWAERDRMHIWVKYEATHPLKAGETVMEWWDDEAREMFEDGFFDRRNLKSSVIRYCEDMGWLEKRP